VGDSPHLKYQKKKKQGTWGTIMKKEMKRDDSVLHILNDLAKGKNEMKETFAKGTERVN
jgi:hypothetical protein